MSSIKLDNLDPPHLPNQQADVSPGSAPAVLALICEIVRARFKPGNGLAWYWDENPTPQPDESNDPDAPRKLTILPAFALSGEIRNYKPAIYVDRGAFTAQQVALGHLAEQKLNTGARAHYALGEVPLTLEVVGSTALESAILADIVWFYLLAGRDEIRRTLGLRDLTMPQLGPTLPGKDDKTLWSTTVAFDVTLNLRWLTVPISPVLREFVVRYRSSGETNPDVFLLAQYLR